MWGGSGKPCGQAHAANRWTHAKLARFTFAFAFCKSNARRRRGRRREQTREQADKQTHTNKRRKSVKNRSKIDEKPSQIDEKLIKIRSRVVLGVQGRFGDASGRVRDAAGTRPSRLKSDLGTPRARQERPGDAQERSQEGPKTLPGRSGATPERVRRDKHRRTRHRNDFWSFLFCRAKAPMCCSYQFL